MSGLDWTISSIADTWAGPGLWLPIIFITAFLGARFASSSRGLARWSGRLSLALAGATLIFGILTVEDIPRVGPAQTGLRLLLLSLTMVLSLLAGRSSLGRRVAVPALLTLAAAWLANAFDCASGVMGVAEWPVRCGVPFARYRGSEGWVDSPASEVVWGGFWAEILVALLAATVVHLIVRAVVNARARAVEE